MNEQRRLRGLRKSSRNEDKLFLETAKEAISEIKEPKNWKKPKDPKKHAGGKKVHYDFKTMLLILLLIVYHRKEYREMGVAPEQQSSFAE
jgi:hypothetical protein